MRQEKKDEVKIGGRGRREEKKREKEGERRERRRKQRERERKKERKARWERRRTTGWTAKTIDAECSVDYRIPSVTPPTGRGLHSVAGESATRPAVYGIIRHACHSQHRQPRYWRTQSTAWSSISIIGCNPRSYPRVILAGLLACLPAGRWPSPSPPAGWLLWPLGLWPTVIGP